MTNFALLPNRFSDIATAVSQAEGSTRDNPGPTFIKGRPAMNALVQSLSGKLRRPADPMPQFGAIHQFDASGQS